MGFLELVKKRYSVRKYKSDEVPKEKLDYVLEAFRLAPSACNKQPYKLFIFETRGKEKLLEVYNRDWFAKAPLIIVACTKKSAAWERMDKKNYADVDLTIALDHLILAATEQGLGTCWIAAFNPKKAVEVFNIPSDLEPLMLVTLGFADDSPREKNRKSIGELVSKNYPLSII